MKKSSAQGRKKSTLKREQIIEATLTLILKQGFNDTSMDQISELAGVSKKTIYSHFSSKVKLFHSVLEHYWETAMVNITQEIDFDQPPRIALKEFSIGFFKVLEAKNTVPLFRLLIGENQRFPNLIDAIDVSNKNPLSASLTKYLTHQTEQGNLNISDPYMAGVQFMGLVKEYDFWPILIGKDMNRSREEKLKTIETSVDMFVSYYEVT